MTQLSLESVNQIKDAKPSTHASLISFDATGLFPNLPHNPTLNHPTSKMLNAHVPQYIIDELRRQLELYLNPNFCRFNGKTYVGVPIDSSLGSLMGELFCDPPSYLLIYLNLFIFY